MDPLMISMRILHIVFGLFWVGTIFYMVLILTPRLRALGPAVQGPVMGALMPVQVPFMIVSASVTVLSGVVITLAMRWGALGTLFATGWGWSMIVGFVTTAAAAVIGFGIVIPTGRRQTELAGSIQGRPPTPEEGQQLGQFAARIGTLMVTNFVLLLIATVTMAIARFV